MKQQAQAVCAQCGLGTNRLQGAGYRQGKVLVVDSQTGKTVGHAMAEEKLKGIVAARPEEVGTIICLGPEVKSKYGTYQSGAIAYQKSRGFCVYDLAGGKVIQSGKLVGSAPPRIKTTKGDASGSDPAYSELTDYILRMVEK